MYHEPDSLGFQLRILLSMNGLSISEAARRAGNIDHAHLSRIVNGKVALTAEKAITLAKVLHCTPYRLMNIQIKRQLWEAKNADRNPT